MEIALAVRCITLWVKLTSTNNTAASCMTVSHSPMRMNESCMLEYITRTLDNPVARVYMDRVVVRTRKQTKGAFSSRPGRAQTSVMVTVDWTRVWHMMELVPWMIMCLSGRETCTVRWRVRMNESTIATKKFHKVLLQDTCKDTHGANISKLSDVASIPQ
jgi:hypothetical protein